MKKNIFQCEKRVLNSILQNTNCGVKGREENGQCKGIFFTSFRTTNKFRRCENIVKAQQDVCDLCKRMREKAKDDGKFVSCEGQPEYEIIGRSFGVRPGVQKCIVFWKKKAKEMQEEYNLHKDFPFYSAREIISWLMIEGGAIFKNAGIGGRPYKRSAVVP